MHCSISSNPLFLTDSYCPFCIDIEKELTRGTCRQFVGTYGFGAAVIGATGAAGTVGTAGGVALLLNLKIEI